MRRQPALWMGILLLAVSSTAVAQPLEFELKFAPTVRKEPYSGRVYLFFSKSAEPRQGPNWFTPEPFVSWDVEDWRPDQSLSISTEDPKLRTFPKRFADLDLKRYRVQAVARFNPWERNVGTGPGNGFSDVVVLSGKGDLGKISLNIQQLVPGEAPFRETRWSKPLRVKSRLLSEFHHRDVSTRAAVVLPASYYDQPDRRYPVLFNIPGFGGDDSEGTGREKPFTDKHEKGVEFLRVFLDPSCPLGHHVFADSANNGPVGTALVSEFIPELDKQFRTIPQPTARFLTGHSSGGWSSLWLQVAYPETFGGTWSTSPDPVDFHDFQRIDMYAPGENMYHTAQGERRPLARFGKVVALWYDDFDRMEVTAGHGGQLHSFEAVFSSRGPDGKPMLAWDRATGAVNTEVAKQWLKYDIRHILESRWTELGPKLAGKLHVFMGDTDTFYLEGATIRLKESLKKLDSDAVVEILPGKDHFNLLSNEVRNRIRNEMAASFLAHHKP